MNWAVLFTAGLIGLKLAIPGIMSPDSPTHGVDLKG